ncbi:FxsB family cyclophane-forming radical SAM/SPASM peptide maturase [Actinomadura sp. WMMA1423]|uniref:FxsB family cyclophane-forming radical SAM/SPASM peptide maturase n=1 Tax=Actinomadura sp. WMMA1423 TaxID=2591108 RepID=UPI001F0D12DD|nr:FxsB family cyclophane-forming radical SAM/SPASM peptide maturase [Actinomadura sp. WMMA1423]
MTVGEARTSTEDEWPATLSVQALLEQGWRPTPFREFVLKIHSRCNLACDYCYMYEMADQSWRRQPRRMSRATIDRTAARIAEHARSNDLSRIAVVLHGGEPLLAGPERIRHAVEAVNSAVDSRTSVSFHLQTNGVLLDSVFLKLFDELDIFVSVSLDGDAQGHDLHRRRANGTGSHGAVMTGLHRLTTPAYRRLFSGLLSTIDLRNDPVATYEALLAHRPPAVDFLLPHGNWDTPPPGRDGGDATPYADWLIAIFDRWYGAPVRETRVRLFTEIIRLLLGRPSHSESIGLSPVAVAVVETDGGIEQVDTLKSAYEGAAHTELHVGRDPFDAALMLPAMAARQIGRRALAGECAACPVHRVCGGGLYTHRYRSGTGFANPSVYCRDLYRLITHVREAVERDVEAYRRRASAEERAG